MRLLTFLARPSSFNLGVAHATSLTVYYRYEHAFLSHLHDLVEGNFVAANDDLERVSLPLSQLKRESIPLKKQANLMGSHVDL